MANVRNLKKDINYVLGDIIEAVYVWNIITQIRTLKKSESIIDEAIEIFDDLIAKVNDKSVENAKSHFKTINKELEEKGRGLIDKINKL